LLVEVEEVVLMLAAAEAQVDLELVVVLQ